MERIPAVAGMIFYSGEKIFLDIMGRTSYEGPNLRSMCEHFCNYYVYC
jgi:hypothetical protein